MKTVQVVLPDELAEQARRAGLLSGSRVESWLRAELQREHTDELFAAMERVTASTDKGIFSPDEIAEELHAMRSERRAAKE